MDDESATNTRDRDEAGFESQRTTRQERREERRVQSLLKDRHTDRSRITELEERLARSEAAEHKGKLSNLDADMAEAEAQARDAFADGDAAAAAKANRRLAELAADRKAAAIMEEQAATAARRPNAPQTSPESADWLERNGSWFNKDQKATRLALLAHDEAINVEGLTVNSPEYFKHIEARVEEKFPGKVDRREDDDDDDDQDDDQSDPPAQARTRAAAANRGAAPVTRASNRNPARTLKASAAEVEAAKISGVTIQEYVARRQIMAKAGTLEGRRR